MQTNRKQAEKPPIWFVTVTETPRSRARKVIAAVRRAGLLGPVRRAPKAT